MQWVAKKTNRHSGFTIVELLIVIVVIGILAAITFVAYNGIQNRGKAAAAQSAASQAAKRVTQVAVESGNDNYPDSQAAFDALNINSSSATYQYSSNVSVNPNTFCITATVQNVSYYINNTSNLSPTEGGCPGHGQGGAAPITNYALNPSAIGSTTNFGQAGGGLAAHTTTVAGDQSHHGPTALRRIINSSGQTGASAKTLSTARPQVNAGQPFTWSFWIYSTKAGTILPYCDGVRVATGAQSGISGTITTVPANTWTKVTASANAGADMYVNQCGGYNLAVASGDTVWFDEFMLSYGPAPAYADGDSTDWAWTGTPNASYSTGPRK